MAHKMVTIIILTYNKVEFTEKCLDFLKRNTFYENVQIIFVDNGSTDGTIDYLEKIQTTYPIQITLIKNKTNLGFAKGCNIGAREIKKGYLVFLNNDVFVFPNWLQNMITCMEKEETRAIVGAKLLFPETQRIQHAGVIILPDGHPDHQYRNFKSDNPKVNIERSYPAVTAACLLIKTEVFRAIGGFDEQYYLGSFEDVDLCLKAYHLGYKIVYCPNAVGIHHQKASSNQISDYESKIMPKNLERFLKKWFPTIYVKDLLINIYSTFIKDSLKSLGHKLNLSVNFFTYYHLAREKLFIIFEFFKIFKRTIPNSSLNRNDELIPPRSMSKHWTSELLDFKETGEEFLGYFKDLCSLKSNESVLEVGSGVGRMAIPLTKYLTSGSYEGFDIIESGITWCKKIITARFPNFHFQKANIYNKAYNPKGKYKASEYRFPYDDNTFDFIFLISIFTHMLPKEVENYLSEITRVLRRNARCMITFFLLNPESERVIDAKLGDLDFKYKYKNFRVVDREILETAIAYEERFVRALYEKYGLSIVEPIHYGNWSNRQKALSYQDIIIAVKK